MEFVEVKVFEAVDWISTTFGLLPETSEELEGWEDAMLVSWMDE